MKQVTGSIEGVNLEQGRDFAMGKGLGASTEYGMMLRLDPEFQPHYGIVTPFTFFGNEEKRQSLLQLNLQKGEHVSLTLNDLSVLMSVQRA